jgi:ribosome-associated protein
MRLDKLAKAAVAALEDIKGRDIVALDVRKMTSMFDWIIVASADSTRQSRALANHLQEKMKALGARMHIMQPATRQYYNLEELWAPPPRSRRKRAADAAR